jgi:hypothetical protein
MCYEIDKVTIYVLLSTKRATSVKNSLIKSCNESKKKTQHKKLDQFSYSNLVEHHLTSYISNISNLRDVFHSSTNQIVVPPLYIYYNLKIFVYSSQRFKF